MSSPATYLFVPADRPERFGKALGSGAERVIVDLEDAVKPDAKEAARVALRAAEIDWARIVVRINAADTAFWAADLDLLAELSAVAVMVPKAEDEEMLRTICNAAGSDVEIVPQIETARGLEDVGRLLGLPQVRRAAFGHLDFAADLGCGTDWASLAVFRSMLVFRSRLANAEPPIESVTPEIGSEDVLIRDTSAALKLGFGGKLLIHPRQVEPVRRIMTPSDADIAWAERVLAADAEATSGAVMVEGRMVDKPVVDAARRILARRQQA